MKKHTATILILLAQLSLAAVPTLHAQTDSSHAKASVSAIKAQLLEFRTIEDTRAYVLAGTRPMAFEDDIDIERFVMYLFQNQGMTFSHAYQSYRKLAHPSNTIDLNLVK